MQSWKQFLSRPECVPRMHDFGFRAQSRRRAFDDKKHFARMMLRSDWLEIRIPRPQKGCGGFAKHKTRGAAHRDWLMARRRRHNNGSPTRAADFASYKNTFRCRSRCAVTWR